MSESAFVSIYEPIEIEIEGEKYKLRKLNRARIREITEWTEKEKTAGTDTAAEVDAIYEQLKIFVDAPAEVLDDLDIHDVQRLIEVITKKVKRQPDGEPEDKEKNVQKPGGENSPQ